MKIVEIKAYPLSYTSDRAFANAIDWHKNRVVTLVKITTDDGLVGWEKATVRRRASLALSRRTSKRSWSAPIPRGSNTTGSTFRLRREFRRERSAVSIPLCGT